MSYEFEPNRLYRMPTHFGPSLGPRQGPDGRKFQWKDNPKVTRYSVSFLSDREQLARLLPPGFEPVGEPVVTVTFSYMTELEWLAGRGYNTLGVSWPAAFKGETDSATGSFLAVLWENMADPIITGREDLGFSKIYCELPPAKVAKGTTRCTASWYGFRFLELEVHDLHEPAKAKPAKKPASDAPAPPPNDGLLHYKYMPKTGHWGQADVAYAVLTPAASPDTVVKQVLAGEGSVRFSRASWEQMPTQFTVVNALAELPVRQPRGARVVKTVGAKDLSDQRILQ